MDLMFGSMISVPAAGGQYCHFCEEWAEEDPEGSEVRLSRMFREPEGRWGGAGQWGGRAEEELQRDISEDRSALPKESEAGGAGWLFAKQ